MSDIKNPFIDEISDGLNSVVETIKKHDKEQEEAKAKEIEAAKTEFETTTKAFQMQLDGLKLEIKDRAKPEKPIKETESSKPKELSDDQNLEMLNKLLRIVRGQEDPRTHVTVITNPSVDHLLSSSRLTEKQVKAIVNCKLAAKLRPEFQPLADFADTVLRAEISGASGWDTLQGIHLAEAYAPRLVGQSSASSQPEVKKHWYSKKSKEGDEKK